jgi:hypothetical protein
LKYCFEISKNLEEDSDEDFFIENTTPQGKTSSAQKKTLGYKSKSQKKIHGNNPPNQKKSKNSRLEIEDSPVSTPQKSKNSRYEIEDSPVSTPQKSSEFSKSPSQNHQKRCKNFHDTSDSDSVRIFIH